MKSITYAIVFLLVQINLFGQYGELNDTCKILSLHVNQYGKLYWTTENEFKKIPFIVEQFRWKKWVKVGEVQGIGVPGKNEYSFQSIPYSGENILRVMQVNEFYVSKEARWTSNTPEVKFTKSKKSKEIAFSTETMYEILNASGTLVKKGWAKSVSLVNLPKGAYVLNYDNATVEFKK